MGQRLSRGSLCRETITNGNGTPAATEFPTQGENGTYSNGALYSNGVINGNYSNGNYSNGNCAPACEPACAPACAPVCLPACEPACQPVCQPVCVERCCHRKHCWRWKRRHAWRRARCCYNNYNYRTNDCCDPCATSYGTTYSNGYNGYNGYNSYNSYNNYGGVYSTSSDCGCAR
ncbi:MAG: hypothetical protein Q4D38_03805 [Planctomycetia bacterium]|nr:hypothetical protein [Planctomycetia bacterium]